MVYGELRLLGRSALRRQGRESILQPTALVHEAWLLMAGNQRLETIGAGPGVDADILVDHLRRRRLLSAAEDRGCSRRRQPCSQPVRRLPHPDDAMTRWENRTALPRIVELRYAGIDDEETAEVELRHATMSGVDFRPRPLRRLQPGSPASTPGSMTAESWREVSGSCMRRPACTRRARHIRGQYRRSRPAGGSGLTPCRGFRRKQLETRPSHRRSGAGGARRALRGKCAGPFPCAS